MRTLILTLVTGERVAIVVAAVAADNSGGRVESVGGALHFVIETFDEIANALDALRVIEDDEAKERAAAIPRFLTVPAIQQATLGVDETSAAERYIREQVGRFTHLGARLDDLAREDR